MKSRNALRMAWIAMALVGCGGCGGGGGGGGGQSSGGGGQPSAGPPPTVATPTVDVAISTPPLKDTMPTSMSWSVPLQGTWTARDLGAGAVFLKITDSAGNFMVAVEAEKAPSTFTFHVALGGAIPKGWRNGTLTVTACPDAACAKPYAGVAGKLDYRIYISDIGEWQTIGRDGSHRSYVPITIDPSAIEQRWEWAFPKDPAARYAAVTRPATGAGSVFVTAANVANDDSQYGNVLFSLNEDTGKPDWSAAVEGHALAPAASRGRVFQSAINSGTQLTVYDAALGQPRVRHGRSEANAITLAPTLWNNYAYFMGGDTGNELRAIDFESGATLWSHPRTGTLVTTPAIGVMHAFYHTGSTLEGYYNYTGEHVMSVPDPESDGTPYPGSVAPVLTSQGLVVVNSWNGVTRAAKLTSFDVGTKQRKWSTVGSYRPLIAAGRNVIYAQRRATSVPTVDAIDESTGNVMWSWTPPTSDAQRYVAGNLLVTDNLLFVSTSNDTSGWTWAIDVNTRQVAWRYPVSGYVVISASRKLYLLADNLTWGNADRLVAFQLH